MEPPKKAFSLFIYSNSIERKNSIVISSQKMSYVTESPGGKLLRVGH